MGIAIIIPDVSFSDTNLGKVTLKEQIAIRALSINAPSSFVGKSCQLGVVFSPAITSQRGVVWSVESGGAYASIDSNGLLTIDSSASGNTVVVKVVSSEVPTVSDTKSIVVTYDGALLYDWLQVDQPSFIDTGYVPNNSTKIEMQFALTQTKTYNHIFGRRTGSPSATDNFALDVRQDQNGCCFSYNGDGSIKSEMSDASIQADLLKHSISLQKNAASYDNREFTFDSTLSDSLTTLFLGGVNNGSGLVNTGGSQPMIGKIYETKIYENNVLIHDYIPATFENIVGMYDVITNEFKQVQGNGIASVGND